MGCHWLSSLHKERAHCPPFTNEVLEAPRQRYPHRKMESLDWPMGGAFAAFSKLSWRLRKCRLSPELRAWTRSGVEQITLLYPAVCKDSQLHAKRNRGKVSLPEGHEANVSRTHTFVEKACTLNPSKRCYPSLQGWALTGLLKKRGYLYKANKVLRAAEDATQTPAGPF